MIRRVATVAAIAALAGCGAAHAATRSWQVADFARIRVEGPFDVRVHAGTPAGVRANGAQAAIDRLSVEQRGDTLVIRPIRTGGWASWTGSGADKLIVDVGVRALAGAMLLGSGDLAIDRVRGDAFDVALSGSGDLTLAAVDVRELRATATGSGDLTLTGRADAAQATLTGTGDIHGDGFLADRADLTLVGSGDLTLGARRTAKVALRGSGDISVPGVATCTIAKSGSGDVTCAHGAASEE